MAAPDLQRYVGPAAVLGLCLYFAPVLVSAWRWQRNPASAVSPAWVFVIVFFSGWTLVGWLAGWWLALKRVT